MSVCRILSLDGGGSWAMIEAMALGRLFPGLSGWQVLGQFDIVAGNSGGSIVLAALLADMTPAAIVSLFRDQARRAQLYVPVSGCAALAAEVGVGPRWSSAGKLAGIEAILGGIGATQLNRVLNRTRIMIPAYALDEGRTIVFRSQASPLGDVLPVTVAQAAHASSSAPVTYFDAPAEVGGVRLWDGAIGGYNNPVEMAVAEAFALGMHDVSVLSIGTGKVWRPLGAAPAGVPPALFAPRADLAGLGAVRLLATAAIGDPPDAATLHASVLTGDRVVRLNPMIQPIGPRWRLPMGFVAMNAENPLVPFNRLVALDMDATHQADVDLIAALAAAWMADAIPNQPLIMDPATGGARQGPATWSAAVAQWDRL